MEWEAPHSLGRPCPVPKLQEVSPQPSASGALSLAFCPCIDLAEGAGTWRAAILEHKALFMVWSSWNPWLDSQSALCTW